ncbi:MAG TPA: iron-containing redox enzyme family protein [Mycobacteriales bacterium]|jgi:hypothetical protein|nr:iron-containing redox enzyme family protein [Mycobacteriales bacterium]
MPYGDVLDPAQLAASPLPTPRGPWTEWLFGLLPGPPGPVGAPPPVEDSVVCDDDLALALYCLYELHYRGFRGVSDAWEWEPSLLAARRALEERFERELRAVATGPELPPLPAALYAVIGEGAAPSVSRFLDEHGTADQFREFAIHRSAYQLKEADPHTWALPRLGGAPKAAMVEIQADEYGAGVERDMHQNLFAVTMSELGLDPSYNAYLDDLPAETLTTVNLVSFFGLHRRLRGALVGHLALFEMTSVEPMGVCAEALRRLGFGPGARHFYEVHVVADAHHETVAAQELAAGLAAQDPALVPDILFGARAVMYAEGLLSSRLVDAWTRGRSSLREDYGKSGLVCTPAAG